MTLVEAQRLLSRFETGTLPREEWTHTAHCIMALLYCSQYPVSEATVKIRSGIKAYNVSVGGENTDTAGYHETITLFYTTAIAAWLVTTGTRELTDARLAGFCGLPFLKTEYILQYYSREALFSREARLGWRAPDKLCF